LESQEMEVLWSGYKIVLLLLSTNKFWTTWVIVNSLHQIGFLK
jgi:hypothetical protein